VLKQEASVSVNLPAFTDYCEKAFMSVYQTNALKVRIARTLLMFIYFQGRSGVEWVIDHLKREYNEFSNKVSSEVAEMTDKVMSHFSHSHQ
jgi:hypothetical protein